MAKDDKKSFVVYLDWFDALEEYTDAEVGQLMRALARYIHTGEEPNFQDRGMRGNWKFMLGATKRASDKWNETRAKRSEAGKRGNANRWGKSDDIANISNVANATSAKDDIANVANVANVAVSVSGSVNVSDNVSVSGSGSVTDCDRPAPAVDMELSKIVQHYQQAIGDFPRSALEKLQKWRQDYSTEMILLAIDKAAEAGKLSWNYINGILSGWQRDGLRTPGDVVANEQQRQNRQRGRQPSETVGDQLARVMAKMDKERGFDP